MKNKLTVALLLTLLIAAFASCASQKYGCPGNPQANTRFKG
jgi:hypothetical protein